MTAGLEPSLQLGFRPEPVDVRSGETNVVPEAPGRNQQVDEPIRLDPPVLHMPLKSVRAMGLTVSQKSEDRQHVPPAVGVPPATTDP